MHHFHQHTHTLQAHHNIQVLPWPSCRPDTAPLKLVKPGSNATSSEPCKTMVGQQLAEVCDFATFLDPPLICCSSSWQSKIIPLWHQYTLPPCVVDSSNTIPQVRTFILKIRKTGTGHGKALEGFVIHTLITSHFLLVLWQSHTRHVALFSRFNFFKVKSPEPIKVRKGFSTHAQLIPSRAHEQDHEARLLSPLRVRLCVTFYISEPSSTTFSAHTQPSRAHEQDHEARLLLPLRVRLHITFYILEHRQHSLLIHNLKELASRIMGLDYCHLCRLDSRLSFVELTSTTQTEINLPFIIVEK